MSNIENEKEKVAKNEEIDSNLEAVKEELEEDTAGVESLLEAKDKEIEELNNKFLRLQADFANYKRRSEKEKESIFNYATGELATKLLEVLDNFERALSTANDKNDGFYQGVDMIYNQILNVLKGFGLEEINSLNEKFDPNLHHGVMTVESNEHEEDTIIEVFQKGYKLRDKVIRPSMVKISK